MTGRTVLYRGSLKSCNYHCSYCPFSKNRMNKRELDRDREQWFSFVRNFAEKAGAFGVRALMVVPYGEALIHPWYWEGLAHISACRRTDVVGAQTNASFSIAESLAYFDAYGGVREKLRLWATFHPEMTTVKEFSDRCRELADKGITLCAGAVGVPEHIGLIQKLREELPEDIYLWINKMDGLRRPYTEEEKKAFQKIDPYFSRELVPVLADESKCTERLFVEGDGRLRICNISKVLGVESEMFCQTFFSSLKAASPTGGRGAISVESKQVCGRRVCSCYLAYGGRGDFMNRILFGPYPLFRIPRRPKAVFFDIEGTLLQKRGMKEGNKAYISADILAGLTALTLEQIPLFFATTLPYQEAKKRCGRIWHLFSGGIFAGGAHLFFWKNNKEKFYYLKESSFTELAHLKTHFHFRILAYRNQEKLYKITLCRTVHHPWSKQDAQKAADVVPNVSAGEVRYFTEGSCLQFVSADADKAEGVRTFCKWMGILPKEAAAAGDSAEDAEMLKLCGI